MLNWVYLCVFFFFKQKTAYDMRISDWSSDVCSSDLAPLVAGLGGVALAYLFYMAAPGLPAKAAQALRPLYLFSLNKWYFDELYDRIFVRPAHAIAFGRAACRERVLHYV